jgi:hypothetical protein
MTLQKPVLPGMETNTEVVREPLDLNKLKQEIDEVFTFQQPLTMAQLNSCLRVQFACRELAKTISEEVPEGKEQTIAINNLLSAALFASHGITRRQVIMGVVSTGIPQSQSQG